MEMWRTDFVQRKRAVAEKLALGECGGSYGEAVIILCVAISAIAADVWPGRGKDRARFVEALCEFVPPDMGATRISLPLLVARLRNKGQTSESELLRGAFLDIDGSRVLTGPEVDKTESEILSICSSISSRTIRDCTYANLLYEEIRSGYAHEYRPGSRADSWPMTGVQDAAVSYVNWVHDPDRHIHFHLEWISDIAVEVAKAVDLVDASLPRASPEKWWVYG